MSRAIIFAVASVVLLTVSMVFLVLGMVALPVSTSLKLALTLNFSYGVFGYCVRSVCPSALYPVLFGDIDTKLDWLLGASTRNTLAKTFIVAPIAAGFTLFCIISTLITLAIANSVLQVISIVLGVISFIATALVAIMVVLVFYPHVAWTGWLYIAAAALALLAVPCLIFSIRVATMDDESDVDSREKDFEANTTAFSGGPLLASAAEPKFQFYGPQTTATNYTTDEMSSISKDYSYRAGPTGYGVVKVGTNSSLHDSNPHLANDVTKPNTMPANRAASNASFFDDTVNLNLGPSTPISLKQKMAPNYVPNVAMTTTDAGYKPMLPYPKSERGSTAYNVEAGAAHGVFDHHPSVEGHQPFTELGDNSLPERNLLPERHMDSDDDSDFTSVSQRPPNVMYQPGTPAQQQYQQLYPNVSQYQPPFQQSQSYQQSPQFQQNSQFQQSPQFQPNHPSLQSSYYGSESYYNQSQPYQQPGYQMPPPQGYAQGPPRPQPRQTASENILNNNPDFAVSSGPRRKPGFVPPAKRYGNPTKPPARPGAASRDGPYGAL